MITDVVLTYQFLKRFALPFTKWKAYKLGIIDANGRVLKKRSSLVTAEERAALGTFDLIVLNLKRLLAKVPGGGSAVGAMAALAHAVAAGRSFEMLLVAIVDQCVEAIGAFDPDVAAAPAVTAIWAAILDELLTPERDRAGAAVAGAHVDFGLV